MGKSPERVYVRIVLRGGRAFVVFVFFCTFHAKAKGPSCRNWLPSSSHKKPYGNRTQAVEHRVYTCTTMAIRTKCGNKLPSTNLANAPYLALKSIVNSHPPRSRFSRGKRRGGSHRFRRRRAGGAAPHRRARDARRLLLAAGAKAAEGGSPGLRRGRGVRESRSEKG